MKPPKLTAEERKRLKALQHQLDQEVTKAIQDLFVMLKKNGILLTNKQLQALELAAPWMKNEISDFKFWQQQLKKKKEGGK